MAGQIPRSFIDDLLGRIDIVDVVEQYVPLKKGGHDYKALCPFHNERSPSFTVSQAKQFYYCFGCGASGSAISFLMEHCGMEFPEAIEDLAARAGVEVPREGGSERTSGPDLTGLYDQLAAAQRFFTRALRQHEHKDKAVDYLRNRGLNGETAAAFDLGYAPAGWDNLLQALGTDTASIAQLETAGLVIAKEDRHYDRFRDRIMFPIHDNRGRVCGFGGRVIGDEEPKYLNSPETPVFQKGRELYGLYRARREVRDLKRLIVVEGYMDVVSLAQFGVNNAVATLGTATTRDHLERLFRVVPEVVFCFDGDAAGKRAAWRALQQTLPSLRDGRTAAFLFLPSGEDPDTLVRKQGSDAFTNPSALTPLSEFMFAELSSQVDMGSIDGRARLVELARPLFASISAGAFYELALGHLAQIAQLDRGPLRQSLQLGSQPAPQVASRRAKQTVSKPLSLIARTIQILLHRPELALDIPDPERLRALEQAGAPLLCDLIDYIQTNPQARTGQLLEHWRDQDAGKHLSQLLARELTIEPSELDAEFQAGIKKLRDTLERAGWSELVSNRKPSEMSEADKEALRERIAKRRPAGDQA